MPEWRNSQTSLQGGHNGYWTKNSVFMKANCSIFIVLASTTVLMETFNSFTANFSRLTCSQYMLNITNDQSVPHLSFVPNRSQTVWKSTTHKLQLRNVTRYLLINQSIGQIKSCIWWLVLDKMLWDCHGHIPYRGEHELIENETKSNNILWEK